MLQVKRTSDQTFHDWDLVPSRDSCSTSQLTPEGAAQHVKLGESMRGKYLEQWRLLPTESAWDQIKVRNVDLSL